VTLVQTSHPIAAGSIDHLHPRGTKNDNSRNDAFNDRLFDLLAPELPQVLDLGCAGGGFVRSVLDRGGYAIGIEGSDYSQKAARAEWPILGESLFTADISHPFFVRSSNRPHPMASFNVVTMWEVLEHLTRDQLELLNLNVHAHLRCGGYFIASINSAPDFFEGVEYHATVEPPAWWVTFFHDRGWMVRPDLFAHFDPHWVRGPATDGAASTPLVLQK